MTEEKFKVNNFTIYKFLPVIEGIFQVYGFESDPSALSKEDRNLLLQFKLKIGDDAIITISVSSDPNYKCCLVFTAWAGSTTSPKSMKLSNVCTARFVPFDAELDNYNISLRSFMVGFPALWIDEILGSFVR